MENWLKKIFVYASKNNNNCEWKNVHQLITVALNMLHDCLGFMVKDLLYNKLLLLKFYFKTLSNGLVCV